MTSLARRARAAQARQPITRENLGFLLAKAGQRWNELLYEGFVAAGFPEVRPSYGSLLVPLFVRTASEWARSHVARD